PADHRGRAGRVPTRVSHRRRDVLSRELQGRADPLPRLRERRTASDHFGSGRAARHSALRGRGRGASKSHAPSSTLRAGDGNGSQRTLVTEARDVVIANAPVSYGAFELTVGILPGVPDGDTVLDEVAVACCRERGYVPTFHHGTGTHVEAPWEIERVLEDTSIGLCLDTGHLLLGGGDPVRAIREWRGRINHFHLKDARLQVVEGI